MSNYTLQSCEDLINRYVNELGGEIITIEEGTLGLGITLLHGANGKKTVLIKEYFINSQTSGHKIRMYNKTPKKYQSIIDNH
jgi:hypothetical protein